MQSPPHAWVDLSVGEPRLALFDLDLTLIPFDSGMAWLRFLVGCGVLEPDAPERYLDCCRQYIAGWLDARVLQRVTMASVAGRPRAEVDAWRDRFAVQVAAEIPVAARALVGGHRSAGDLCGIVTATNDFLAEPFVRAFEVDLLLASIAEQRDARYTGEIAGELCHGAGKIRRIELWLAGRGLSWKDLAHSVFYSDSISDLPLLERVAEPVAVRPDAALRAQALARGWRIVEDLADAT